MHAEANALASVHLVANDKPATSWNMGMGFLTKVHFFFLRTHQGALVVYSGRHWSLVDEGLIPPQFYHLTKRLIVCAD